MPRGHQSFSGRTGFKPDNPAITIREDAPSELRMGIAQILRHDCQASPQEIRGIVCRVLRESPNSNNWSEDPVWSEVETLLKRCEWFKVYDIIEAVFESIGRHDRAFRGDARTRTVFTAELNELMAELGVGWQLVEGEIRTRGDSAYEAVIHSATNAIGQSGRATSLNELNQALADLSRRPIPDCSGAIQHANAALECFCREVAGNDRATLGALVNQNPELFPKPLDNATHALFGYASQFGRHISESKEPTHEQAMLVVGIVAILMNYLSHKLPPVDGDDFDLRIPYFSDTDSNEAALERARNYRSHLQEMIGDAVVCNRTEEIGGLNEELAKLEGLIAEYGEREKNRARDASQGH